MDSGLTSSVSGSLNLQSCGLRFGTTWMKTLNRCTDQRAELLIFWTFGLETLTPRVNFLTLMLGIGTI